MTASGFRCDLRRLCRPSRKCFPPTKRTDVATSGGYPLATPSGWTRFRSEGPFIEEDHHDVARTHEAVHGEELCGTAATHSECVEDGGSVRSFRRCGRGTPQQSVGVRRAEPAG